MTELLTIDQVRKAALNGNVDIAIQALHLLDDAGDSSASASLSELLAYKGRWEECIICISKFLVNLKVASTGNVFNDMICLFGRAGHETGCWKQIQQACESALVSIKNQEFQDWERERYSTILSNLVAYAQRGGTPPHELIRLFGVNPDSQSYDPEYLRASYEDAVRNVGTYRPDLQKSEQLIMHQFSLAKAFQQKEDIVRIYLTHQNLPFSFEDAVYVAKELLIKNQPDIAWTVIKEKIPVWIPLDPIQVVPVVLLIDEHIKPIMTKERCEIVLTTTRGSRIRHI